MKVAPVRRYAEPVYPTNEILKEHPELLARIPARWRANPVVLAALTSVLVLSSGVRAKASSTRVAPIFQHGVGRGVIACVSVAPPAFLSEEEARQVIVEEGKRAGISFKTPGATVQTAVPLTEESGVLYPDEPLKSDGGPSKPPASRSGREARKWESWQLRDMPLQLDGTNTLRKVSFVYVSKGDFDTWEHPGGKARIPDTGFDLVGTASRLRDGLIQSQPGGSYGVFYDPVVMTEWRRPDEKKPAFTPEAEAREELRKQVKDFIEWLKAQGVI